MASIELDDQTAKQLQDAAASVGVSVDAYVRTRVLAMPGASKAPKPSPDDFDLEAELDRLSISAPPLSADFSRADIYPDDY